MDNLIHNVQRGINLPLENYPPPTPNRATPPENETPPPPPPPLKMKIF